MNEQELSGRFYKACLTRNDSFILLFLGRDTMVGLLNSTSEKFSNELQDLHESSQPSSFSKSWLAHR